MREPLSFVVIAHHNHSTLNACLMSVERNAQPLDELILVLNNPDQKTLELARTKKLWKIVFESEVGPGAARNRGAKESSHSIISFLDADIAIPLNWCEIMLRHFQNPWIAAGQSRIVQEKASGLLNLLKRFFYIKFNSRLYERFERPVGILFTLDTATLMVRRNWFNRVGGFDSTFQRLEDTDFSLRLLYQGGDLFFEDSVFATEINDPQESLLSYFQKQYASSSLIPLLHRKHGLNISFPFADRKQKSPRYTKFLPWPFKLVNSLSGILRMIAIVKSPHLVEVFPRYSPGILSAKKHHILGTPGHERSFWVGKKELIVDLMNKTTRLL